MQIIWIVLIVSCTIVVSLLWKITIRFSITGIYPQGVVLAVSLHLNMIRPAVVKLIGAVKKEEKDWIFYYSRYRHPLKKAAIQEIMQKDRKKPSKTLFRDLMSAIDKKKLYVRLYYGSEDAARCALVCGLIDNIISNIVSAFFQKRRIISTPVYNQRVFHLDLEGILIVHTVQIISAVAKEIIRKTRKKHKNKSQKERDQFVVPSSN